MDITPKIKVIVEDRRQKKVENQKLPRMILMLKNSHGSLLIDVRPPQVSIFLRPIVFYGGITRYL
jgi:hypothetical protein